jgi:predicted Zn-dependent peptidase
MATVQLSDPFAQVPSLGPERPVVWPARTRRKLANGLEVVLVESHTIPKFTGELYFRSGNAVAAATAKAPGLAEITATVVRTGTEKRSSRQIEEDLRRIGADVGTSAGADTTAIGFNGLAEFSGDLLKLVAELAQQASFPADEFERERRQMIEGLRIARTTPSFLASERMRRVLFGSHPYAIIAPTETQVKEYRLGQLVEFYRTHYTPGNALLIAVGDFAAPQMMEQIERIFGSWKPATVPVVPDTTLPELHGRRVHLVHLPESVQTQVVVANHAITRKHPDWLRLALANSIYGGAFNSRLIINIREQKGYTYSPRSGVHALRQHGYFSVNAAVRNDVVAASLTEIFYEIDRMRSLAVAEDELSDARTYMSGVFSLGLATQDGLASQLSTVYLNELPDNELETYRQRVRALSAADVLTAARAYFDSPNAQITIVGDRGQIGDQARLFGEVTEYSAEPE